MRCMPRQEWIAGGILLAAVLGLGYGPGQPEFAGILAFYLPAFAVYMWVLARPKQFSLRFVLGTAVLLRLLLAPAMPQLSDDVYRFIWDGRLLVNGINPFAHLPSYYLELPDAPTGISQELYRRLNSQEYFTVYPPLAQGVFASAAALFPKSIYGSAMVMKGFLLACELGTVFLMPKLLRRFGLEAKRSAVYLLNPLVLLEVMGNLHFEGVMICFLSLSLWWLYERRVGWSAAAMALSIAAKLLPLMFLPFLFRRLGWRKSLAYFAALGAGLMLLFAPLLGEAFFSGFSSSLELYFRRFEFNASIYYVLRWIGYQYSGYNHIAVIGPALALCTFFGIVLAALLEKRMFPPAEPGPYGGSVGGGRRAAPYRTNALLSANALPLLFLYAITLYLLFTPTVHPWYLCLPLFCCAFTRFRFPLVWSGLIVLTYINYSYEPYWENLWVVAFEYILVGGSFLYEWRAKHENALGLS